MHFISFRPLLLCMIVLAMLPLAGAKAAVAEQSLPETSIRAQKHRELAYDMANLVMSMLHDQKKLPSERMEALQRGFADILDIEWIARFVIGANWNHMTMEQRERYVALYRTYLTKIYVEYYAESTERNISDIKVSGVFDTNDGNFIARTEVLFAGGERLKVDYRVRGAENDNRILDVVVEGVSLLASHRAEFSAIAASRGVEAVIAGLEKKLNMHAKEQELTMSLAK